MYSHNALQLIDRYSTPSTSLSTVGTESTNFSMASYESVDTQPTINQLLIKGQSEWQLSTNQDINQGY